ncbi:MAG: preprotein translocase subunit SecE [Eubacteriales bacterium]|nr:preprotein translocase subunit SecE [Eubacteriales bacterium]MDD4391011.1 preprotein translocase subunit SecE [Eubacteriales bacterium]
MAEGNKKAPSTPKKRRPSIKEHFRGIKIEMKKVVWPTKKELSSYTAIVIATCTFFALAFWAIDSTVLAGLRVVLGVTL